MAVQISAWHETSQQLFYSSEMRSAFIYKAMHECNTLRNVNNEPYRPLLGPWTQVSCTGTGLFLPQREAYEDDCPVRESVMLKSLRLRASEAPWRMQTMNHSGLLLISGV